MSSSKCKIVLGWEIVQSQVVSRTKCARPHTNPAAENVLCDLLLLLIDSVDDARAEELGHVVFEVPALRLGVLDQHRQVIGWNDSLRMLENQSKQ